ncbi:MAG TPA: threonine/serine dehydratase, partial [Anaerolineae bacterium]|nr:threonine/serine dehydratase [Anaerolineae bacterium]
MPVAAVTMRDIYAARQRIASIVTRTPLIHSAWLSERVDHPVYLKLECLQETGSFKLRGAANKLLSLTTEEKSRGVITVSTGNHGRAVSYVARLLGIRAVVCMSQQVPANKVEAIERLGGEVVVAGGSYDEAEAHSLAMQKQEGLTMIDPFDDPLVIAGQGTIGLELLEDLPQLDSAVIPLSGGGLFSGIALALKTADPGIHITGVSMERGPAMVESLRAGRVVEIVEEPTLADALAGGLGEDNRYTFDMVRRYADDTALVAEEEIADGMVFMLATHRLVVEGGGAVG